MTITAQQLFAQGGGQLSVSATLAQAAYHFRGGKDPDLPGRATVSGDGRADAQLAVDAAGELYILTKTDGTIRSVAASVR